MSHNGIVKMEGLSSLVNLRVLDLSSNKLKSIDDIQSLTRYQCFSRSSIRSHFHKIEDVFLFPDLTVDCGLDFSSDWCVGCMFVFSSDHRLQVRRFMA